MDNDSIPAALPLPLGDYVKQIDLTRKVSV